MLELHKRGFYEIKELCEAIMRENLGTSSFDIKLNCC